MHGKNLPSRKVNEETNKHNYENIEIKLMVGVFIMMLRIGRRKPTEDFNQLLLIKKEVGKSKNDDVNNDVLLGHSFMTISIIK